MMPTRNPILEEVRAARDAIAREHDFDIERIGRAMQERQAQSARPVVRLQPKRIPQKKITG
jgi:hypothetical protein